jgi:hypothetical protein
VVHGSDGTTSRILTAKRPPGSGWERLGVAIDAGFAGDSDSYGAESPYVVKAPGGYLMVYGGSDGEISRLHMASSSCVGVSETSGAAHSLQNFAPSRFSLPHAEQMAIRGV